MSSETSGKIIRTYGETGRRQKAPDIASNLFDKAFASAPPPPRSKKVSSQKTDDLPKPESDPDSPPSSAGGVDRGVFSPPVSIPDSEPRQEQSDHSDDDHFTSAGLRPTASNPALLPLPSSQSSTSSLTGRLDSATLMERSPIKARPVLRSAAASTGPSSSATTTTSPKRSRPAPMPAAFDLETEMDDGEDEDDQMDDDDDSMMPEPKRQKSDQSSPSDDLNTADPMGTMTDTVSSLPIRKQPVYKHKWDVADELDDEPDSDGKKKTNEFDFPSEIHHLPMSASGTSRPMPSSSYRTMKSTDVSSSSSMSTAERVRIRNVMEAHQCLESGEHDDFKEDLEYILSSLQAPSTSMNIKCLSTISLARKCISSEFRQFFRTRNQANQTLRLFADAYNHPGLALCISAVIYVMARDKLCLAVDAATLRLLVHLLKMDKEHQKSPEYQKFAKQIWAVLCDWLAKAQENTTKELKLDFTEESLSTSFLILESLVYITALNTDQNIKNELLNLGALQWIVLKVDKTITRLSEDAADVADEDHLMGLRILERCFRILESCTVYNKKNQAFLISHRSSLLIQSCGRLISVCHHSVVANSAEPDGTAAQTNISCLSAIIRVLMNLSNENELCCTKLGQMSGFLPLCMSTFTHLGPKFAPTEKRFDLTVMISSLLINMVERCNSNRRKLLEIETPLYDPVTNAVTKYTVLEALCRLFVRHETAARSVDEELDHDLELDDVPEPGDEDGNGAVEAEEVNDGRLRRDRVMTEDEIAQTMQAAMNKASVHMEDSVIASYIALLVGCLIQQNEDAVTIVKSFMPDTKLNPMIDQLQRFLEFMKITDEKNTGGNRSVEKIIDLLDRLN